MNMKKAISCLKASLADNEKRYTDQEQMIENGLPTGWNSRWKQAHDYIHNMRNNPKTAPLIGSATALAAAVMIAFLNDPENPGNQDTVYWLIYRYNWGITDEFLFQHNFAWLLMNRAIENYEVEKSFDLLEQDADTRDIEFLRDALHYFFYREAENLYLDLLETPSPRHL
jgi:hypothetical protein